MSEKGRGESESVQGRKISGSEAPSGSGPISKRSRGGQQNEQTGASGKIANEDNSDRDSDNRGNRREPKKKVKEKKKKTIMPRGPIVLLVI